MSSSTDHAEQISDTEEERIVPVGELIEQNDRLRDPVIDGLLRRGETANIIAAAKVGKSWLAYSLALSVATGSNWLHTFPCIAGRVLLIDNELHPEVLASRIPKVADALSIGANAYNNAFDVMTLRGRSIDLFGLAKRLAKIPPGTYNLIILDAFYRSIPKGFSENDNAQMTQLYNVIDAITHRMGAAWVNIHHASKGNQAGKAIVDVGSGANAQSRAADCHLILRPLKQDNVILLEAAVRSFPAAQPLALRWTFPLWSPATDIDLTKLDRRNSNGDGQRKKDDAAFKKILTAIDQNGPTTRSALEPLAGISNARLRRLLPLLESKQRLTSKITTVNGQDAREYLLPVKPSQ